MRMRSGFARARRLYRWVVTKTPSDPRATDRQVNGDGPSARQADGHVSGRRPSVGQADGDASGRRPRSDRPSADTLDELSDDAIVAQQSQPHSPKPRAQVAMESRSVVIAPDAELGGAPPPPEVKQPRHQLSTEPTLVI